MHSKVYAVKSITNEELVVKVPKISLSLGYHDLFFETQVFKLLGGESMPKVHEEILEIDPENESIFNYVVIENRPQHSMLDFLTSKTLGAEDEHLLLSQQIWTEPKYLYLIFQSLKALHFLHENGIYHAEICPPNLLISQGYDILVSDLVLSVFGKEGDEGLSLRGINY